MATLEQLPETKKKVNKIHPKQLLLNFVESEGGVVWQFYETGYFYNIAVLLASEVALSGLLYRMPKGVMYHINSATEHFEFFIDKDFV